MYEKDQTYTKSIIIQKAKLYDVAIFENEELCNIILSLDENIEMDTQLLETLLWGIESEKKVQESG